MSLFLRLLFQNITPLFLILLSQNVKSNTNKLSKRQYKTKDIIGLIYQYAIWIKLIGRLKCNALVKVEALKNIGRHTCRTLKEKMHRAKTKHRMNISFVRLYHMGGRMGVLDFHNLKVKSQRALVFAVGIFCRFPIYLFHFISLLFIYTIMHMISSLISAYILKYFYQLLFFIYLFFKIRFLHNQSINLIQNVLLQILIKLNKDIS